MRPSLLQSGLARGPSAPPARCVRSAVLRGAPASKSQSKGPATKGRGRQRGPMRKSAGRLTNTPARGSSRLAVNFGPIGGCGFARTGAECRARRDIAPTLAGHAARVRPAWAEDTETCKIGHVVDQTVAATRRPQPRAGSRASEDAIPMVCRAHGQASCPWHPAVAGHGLKHTKHQAPSTRCDARQRTTERSVLSLGTCFHPRRARNRRRSRTSSTRIRGSSRAGRNRPPGISVQRMGTSATRRPSRAARASTSRSKR